MADRRPTTYRRTVAASVAACVALGVLGVAETASAASRAESIATALTASPLFVDPSESSAVSAPAKAAILRGIAAAPAPVYVVVTPVVAGDEFGGEETTMLSSVEAVLAKPGIYVTVSSSGSYLETQVKDEDALGDSVDEAQEGANADLSYNSPIGPLIQRFLTLLADPATAHAEQVARDAAARASASAAPSAPSGAGTQSAGSGHGVPVGVVAALALAVLALLAGRRLVRRRSRIRVAVPGELSLPPQVFEAARAAAIHDLQVAARSAVVDFGELLDADDLVPSDGTRPAQQALQESLDAYDAAGRVLDDAAGAADLAGVLVLVDTGRDALARAHSAAKGSPRAPQSPVCFFNPLHGRSTTTASWEVEPQDQVTVPACAACAKDVRAGRQPDVLRDAPIPTGGRPMDHGSHGEPPYYERGRALSVWAATGYGAFGNDLVQSVLTTHHYGRTARS